MATDRSVNTRSKSTGMKNIGKIVNGDVRLKIAKESEYDIDDSFIACFDRILADSARQIVNLEGINYEVLSITDRLLITRFRCPLCGVLPLYFLDLKYLNKTRCGKCSIIVGLKNSGKYGRIRKQIAISTCKTIDEMLSSN